MPRPTKKRIICARPGHHMFGPRRMDSETIITLSVDAFETIRLIDFENMDQIHAAQSMGVARTTVQRLYKEARKLIATALVEGNQLVIKGGHFVVSKKLENHVSCHRKGSEIMLLAVAMDNNKVSNHYGKAEKYCLCTVVNGQIKRKDYLIPDSDKMGGCRKFMLSLGVDVVIAGGMGGDSLERYTDSDIKVYQASGTLDEVLTAYFNNDLDQMKLHADTTDCHGDDAECNHHDDGCQSDYASDETCCGKHEHDKNDCCHE